MPRAYFQICCIHLDEILELVHVLVESNLELDQTGSQLLHLVSVLRGQLVAGATEITEPELQEPAALCPERRSVVCGGVVLECLIEVTPEHQVHGPLRKLLSGFVRCVPDIFVCVDASHERAPSVGDCESGGHLVERGETVRPRARTFVADDGTHELLGPGDPLIDGLADGLLCDAGVVVEHGREGSGSEIAHFRRYRTKRVPFQGRNLTLWLQRSNE